MLPITGFNMGLKEILGMVQGAQGTLDKLFNGDQEKENLITEVAKTLAAEAANQGVKGMTAVAGVMGNRRDLWNKDLLEVISAKNQFYGYTAENRDSIYAGVKEDADKIARDLVEGKLKDTSGGATFFRLEDEPIYSWHGDKTKTIGAHTFHKDK